MAGFCSFTICLLLISREIEGMISLWISNPAPAFEGGAGKLSKDDYFQ
jgi:hypothetical protein